MKVIKRVEWTHKFTCVGCKSELEAEAGDVKRGEFGGSYCESGSEGFYVECVVCGTTLLLCGGERRKDVVSVPEDIKIRARKDKR